MDFAGEEFDDALLWFSQQEGLANSIAGFGDTLSFGVSAWVRGQDGIVDDSSGSYVIGAGVGLVWGTVITAGTNESINATRSTFSTKVFRWGVGKFGQQFGKFKIVVGPLHFHLGPGRIMMHFHQPYQILNWAKAARGLSLGWAKAAGVLYDFDMALNKPKGEFSVLLGIADPT